MPMLPLIQEIALKHEERGFREWRYQAWAGC